MPSIAVIQFRNACRALKEQEALQTAIGDRASLSFFDTYTTVHERELNPDLLTRFDAVVFGGSGDLFIDGGCHTSPTSRQLTDSSIARVEKLTQSIIAQDFPAFGICFGHQVMAHHLGGTVRHCADEGKFGTVTLTKTLEGESDPVLENVPKTFSGNYAHHDVVKKLPERACGVVLASAPNCCHALVRYGSRVYTSQFHPELTRAHMLERITAHPGYIPAGVDPIAVVQETPYTASILKNFVCML
ncbi:MAG: gamma-glutamyl-gamma-aminobutyrate hydrolase family protein [Patescibacteria group bacterium]